MAENDRRTSIDGDQITDGTISPEELNTENTPEDEFVLEYNGITQKMFWSEKLKQVSIGQNRYWNMTPTFNGSINLLGWYRPLNTGETLTNASPVVTDEPGYGSYFILQVSGAVGIPFDITITGVTISETGVYTPSDTDTITVTANGYYRTNKLFVSTGTLTVEAGDSCSLNIFRGQGWDNNNNNYVVDAIRIEFTPASAVWKFAPIVRRLNGDGTTTVLLSEDFNNTNTYTLAGKDLPGKFEKTNLNFSVQGYTLHEGLMVEVDQTSLFNFNMEIIYHV